MIWPANPQLLRRPLPCENHHISIFQRIGLYNNSHSQFRLRSNTAVPNPHRPIMTRAQQSISILLLASSVRRVHALSGTNTSQLKLGRKPRKCSYWRLSSFILSYMQVSSLLMRLFRKKLSLSYVPLQNTQSPSPFCFSLFLLYSNIAANLNALHS